MFVWDLRSPGPPFSAQKSGPKRGKFKIFSVGAGLLGPTGANGRPGRKDHRNRHFSISTGSSTLELLHGVCLMSRRSETRAHCYKSLATLFLLS